LGLRYWDLGARSSPSQRCKGRRPLTRFLVVARDWAKRLGQRVGATKDSGSVHSKTSCGSGASLMEVNASGLGLQQWSKRNSRSRLRNGGQKRQAGVPAALARVPAVLYLQTC